MKSKPSIIKTISATLRRIDMVFLITVLALTVYGLIMVFSASSPSAFYNHGDSMYFFKRQAIWAVVGVITMFIVATLNYKALKKYAMPSYVVTMILMLLVVIVGQKINGAKRWLNLGFTTVQPSEIAKITIIFVCAIMLSNISEIKVKKNMHSIVACGIIIGVSGGLLLLQPHFSALLIIIMAVLVMMLVAGIPFRLFVPAGIVGIAAIFGLAMSADYRRERMLSFLDPFKYKMESGYQVVQSLYAIGSGSFTGLGLGRSRQKFLYIPEPQNDFIFSIICEELGFIGAMLVIALFTVLLWRAVKIALKAPDRFGMLLTFGLISLTIVQVLFNIAVTTSSVPPTGIPLPFFSAGGTSFVFQMISMGVILNISAQGKD